MIKKNLEKQRRKEKRKPAIPYTKIGKSKKDIIKKVEEKDFQKILKNNTTF